MGIIEGKQIIIKKNIYDESGRIYIAKGKKVTLNDRSIDKFKHLGIWEQIIQNEEEESEAEDRKSLEDRMKKTHEKYKKLSWANFKYAMEFVQKIIFEERIFTTYPHLQTLLDHAEACYAHSIDVAILAVVLAQAMGYDEEAIRDIAIGALLHDIGFLFIDREILNKRESDLTKEEMDLKQKHCSLGVMTMKNLGIPFKSQKIIEQHHEKLDGTGYPNQLKAEEIYEEAKLVTIVEVLDIETSYRGKGPVKDIEEVIEEMYNLPEKYSRRYTTVLKNTVGIR